jgi:hypothetical protein
MQAALCSLPFQLVKRRPQAIRLSIIELAESPLAIRPLGEAALFQRLQRKGYGSIADVSACRPDMLGDLGGRKGALLVESVSDRRAYGLARLRLVACLRLAFWLRPWPRSCLPRGKLFERPDLALGDLRLQFSDLRADAFESCVHGCLSYPEHDDLLLRHSCSIPLARPVSFRADQEVQIGLLRTYFHYGEFEQNSLDERDLLHPIAVTNFSNSIPLVDRQRFYPIESDTRLAADFGADLRV